jgi:hypothetical protein
MIRELVLKELAGGLWHTTHPDRFKKILESGGIWPEPDIPENERCGTRDGRESYSYVRFIGGVSLFDLSSWKQMTPRRPQSGPQHLHRNLYGIPLQLRCRHNGNA